MDLRPSNKWGGEVEPMKNKVLVVKHHQRRQFGDNDVYEGCS
jgi:hypothetical protein